MAAKEIPNCRHAAYAARGRFGRCHLQTRGARGAIERVLNALEGRITLPVNKPAHRGAATSLIRASVRGMGMATTQQRLLFRYLDLPRRKSRAPNAPAQPEFPPLQDLVAAAWQRLPTIGERHIPALTAQKEGEGRRPEDGKRYIVPLRRQVHPRSRAVILRMCVYTGGEVAGFAPRELEAAEAEVNYTHVQDENGQTLAPGIEFSVLLFGRLALIQNRAGAGAAAAVQRMVHAFGRAVHGATFVQPSFLAVSPTDIKDEIEKAGGIVAVSFGVLETDPEPGAAVPLSGVRQIEHRLGGERTRVRVNAASNETLDSDEAMRMLEEPAEDGLENVHLHLDNGETLSAGRAILGKSVTVELANGVPSCDNVDRELRSYLHELMLIDGQQHQAVNVDGWIGDKLQLVHIERKRR